MLDVCPRQICHDLVASKALHETGGVVGVMIPTETGGVLGLSLMKLGFSRVSCFSMGLETRTSQHIELKKSGTLSVPLVLLCLT